MLYLDLFVYIIIVAAVVQALEMIIERVSPALYMSLGIYDQAVQEFAKANSLNPADPEPDYYTSRTYLSVGEYAKALGYGALSGIELPGENAGLIPDPDWKRKYQNESWTTGDTYIASMGQGLILSTPLQVLISAAVLANDGKYMRPTMVREILDSEGNVVKPFEHFFPLFGGGVRKRVAFEYTNSRGESARYTRRDIEEVAGCQRRHDRDGFAEAGAHPRLHNIAGEEADKHEERACGNRKRDSRIAPAALSGSRRRCRPPYRACADA